MPVFFQVVSGLPKETEGENLLNDALRAQGIVFHRTRLSDHAPMSCGSSSHSMVVLLLPVWGDNDLTDETSINLENLVSHHIHQDCAVVVVAHGDRHVSDEFVSPNTPFSIKVRRLFSNAGAFDLLATKLDRFTADVLAREIIDLANAMNFSDVRELNSIARLLPRAPKWHLYKRLLDFYDNSTGHSLLRSVERSVQAIISHHVQMIAPRILKMTHAGLDDKTLSDLSGVLHSEAIDLGSNNLSWGAIVPRLGACRWLGLAANGLSQTDLIQLPKQLEHLYLHKNSLHEFLAMPEDIARLKSLSLYRNRLTFFNWPAGQTALTYLNLGANPISALPESLSNCAALESLGLARTKFTSLPEWIFYLPNLRELDISYIEDQIPKAQIAHLRRRRISLVTRPGLVIS